MTKEFEALLKMYPDRAFRLQFRPDFTTDNKPKFTVWVSPPAGSYRGAYSDTLEQAVASVRKELAARVRMRTLPD